MNSTMQTSRDPVCGTPVSVADSRYAQVCRGLTYHFCCEQCRERFAESPALYTSQRIADIRPIVKQRRLRFVAPDAELLRAACDRLLAMRGVTTASPDKDGVLIEFDLRQASLRQLESVAAASGLVPKGGLHVWRRALWRFFDQTELDNAAHPAGGACCNRPPTRLRSGR